ncbi:glutathione synthetase [Acrasis kona]|uniref:Glutathione synthetase n=1 Tax=Acrasis kona TaxID=1008807 RepID=A0AAW2Z1I1_9EUKA
MRFNINTLTKSLNFVSHRPNTTPVLTKRLYKVVVSNDSPLREKSDRRNRKAIVPKPDFNHNKLQTVKKQELDKEIDHMKKYDNLYLKHQTGEQCWNAVRAEWTKGAHKVKVRNSLRNHELCEIFDELANEFVANTDFPRPVPLPILVGILQEIWGFDAEHEDFT